MCLRNIIRPCGGDGRRRRRPIASREFRCSLQYSASCSSRRRRRRRRPAPPPAPPPPLSSSPICVPSISIAIYEDQQVRAPPPVCVCVSFETRGRAIWIFKREEEAQSKEYSHTQHMPASSCLLIAHHQRRRHSIGASARQLSPRNLYGTNIDYYPTNHLAWPNFALPPALATHARACVSYWK